MSLPPVIRVALLPPLAAALPWLALMELAAVTAALAVAAFALDGLPGVRRLGLGVWRLRWLLLAIGVLYLGFTHGEPLWTFAPGLSAEGLAEGLRRMLLLVSLVAGVHVLVLRTPVRDLIDALASMLQPLRGLRLEPARFAVRAGLALEQVQALERRLLDRAPGQSWLAAAAETLAAIEQDARR